MNAGVVTFITSFTVWLCKFWNSLAAVASVLVLVLEVDGRCSRSA